MDFSLKFNLSDTANARKHIPLDFNQTYDIIIIGGGPAGLNAALYAARKGWDTAIVSGRPGGQVTDTSSVENYLGTISLTGEELVRKFTEHVDTLEVPALEDDQVESVSIDGDGVKNLHLESGKTVKAQAVIVASGSKPRKLNIPGEKEYAGRGVAYCAICDAPLFRDKTVVVAGGGNSAVEASLDIAKIAKKVTLVHRSQLRADRILIDKLTALANVEVRIETQIIEVVGEKVVTGIQTRSAIGEEIIPTDGLFIEIGYLPNSESFKNLLKLADSGEILINERNETSQTGIFAAGDVTQVPYKQIVIAAGEGAKAALSANEYLNRLKS